MHKAGAIILILFMFISVNLAAQQGGDEPDIETDWDVYHTDLYVRGDQLFVISLGTVFPTIFINNGSFIDPKFTPPVGGTGSLAYNYYLGPRLFIGGEISGQFIHTLGGNTLFIIPLGLRVGTQFIAGRFEFPLYLSVGMNWHRYGNFTYYGLYAKAAAAAYFRATSEWSFGLSSSWSWYPQWTKDKQYNVDGNFADIMLTARYHF